jgi:hypothetical protein
MKKLVFRLPLLLLLGIISCTDEGPIHVDTFPAIYGTVKDAQGNPVKDAEVRIIFDIVPVESTDTLRRPVGSGLDYITPNPFVDAAQLMLISENGGDISLKLYRGLGFHDLKKILWQTVIQPGQHTMNFSMQDTADTLTNFPNGIYTVAMEHNDSIYSRVIFYNNPYESGAFLKTDTQGKFVLNYSIFEKLPLPLISAAGNQLGYFQIGNMATLHIVKGNSETKLLTRIETTKVADLTFTLE